MSTQKLTNEQTTMLWDGIASSRKWWGNTIPTSSSSRLLNMMLPSHHHITRIIDDFHYFWINAILRSVQLTYLSLKIELFYKSVSCYIVDFK